MRYRIVKVFFFLCFLPSSLFAEHPHLKELHKKAIEKNLAEHPRWRAMMHYWDNWVLPGYTSFADDPNFFLSSKGKTNSEAELLATLSAFFSARVENDDLHPNCRFLARLQWLTEELQIDETQITKVQCKEYLDWFKALAPEKLTLIFPATYLNNPASSFGHTLLRIDAKGQDTSNRPLAYAANYGAYNTDSQGLFYAIKGIFGFYKGSFSVTPYYKLIRQYNDLESRDIWEYELNFSQAEIELMLKHIWELRGTGFDYYFFGENCSFMLLALFDVVRPELELTKAFPFWAIPIDTAREVLKVPGMLGEAVWRPSLNTLIEQRSKQLGKKEQKLVRDLANQKEEIDVLQSFTVEDRAKVLELASDYFTVRSRAGKIDLPDSKLESLGHQLLLERSQLSHLGASFSEPKPPKYSPDQGHLTRRLRLGMGYEAERWFYELGLRPAYHDLLDPRQGHVAGSELRFFELNLRGYQSEKLKFHSFSPLTIKSISPYSPFFKPKSWNLELLYKRDRIPKDSLNIGGLENILKFNGGSGLASEFFEGQGMVFSFAQAAAEWEPNYRDNIALGGGGVWGAWYDFSQDLRVKLDGKVLRHFVGEKHSEWEFGVSLAYQLERNLSFKFGANRRRKFEYYFTGIDLGLDLYF